MDGGLLAVNHSTEQLNNAIPTVAAALAALPHAPVAAAVTVNRRFKILSCVLEDIPK